MSIPGIPMRKSLNPAANEPSTSHSTRQPNNWYANTTKRIVQSDTLFVFSATQAAETARNTDLMRMLGTTAAGGIPKSRQLMIGDKTAVIKPTFMPYLYAATSVKKYIGRKMWPPFGIRWQSCGKTMLPATNNVAKRYVLT